MNGSLLVWAGYMPTCLICAKASACLVLVVPPNIFEVQCDERELKFSMFGMMRDN